MVYPASLKLSFIKHRLCIIVDIFVTLQAVIPITCLFLILNIYELCRMFSASVLAALGTVFSEFKLRTLGHYSLRDICFGYNIDVSNQVIDDYRQDLNHGTVDHP